MEDFIKQNNISAKVDFSQKEVFLNLGNARELSKKAEICKIDPSEVGVPFLWNNGTCLVGEQDIINFFKEKAGIQ